MNEQQPAISAETLWENTRQAQRRFDWNVERIAPALHPLGICLPCGDSNVQVATTCIYPAGSLAHVVIRANGAKWIVSDEGRAVKELAAANRKVSDTGAFLRKIFERARHYGELTARDGEILMLDVQGVQLLAAVCAVASASVEAAAYGMKNIAANPPARA